LWVAENLKKVKHLIELPKASTHLTLWKADLSDEGSFDEAIKGCSGVFHVATPMDFESKDPEVRVFLVLTSKINTLEPLNSEFERENTTINTYI
jgi:hypothetical protein